MSLPQLSKETIESNIAEMQRALAFAGAIPSATFEVSYSQWVWENRGDHDVGEGEAYVRSEPQELPKLVFPFIEKEGVPDKFSPESYEFRFHDGPGMLTISGVYEGQNFKFYVTLVEGAI